MLGILSANACVDEDLTCIPDPTNPAYVECCTGLTCVQVTPGIFKCEPKCEDHPGHSCNPGVRECCPPLDCVTVSFNPDVHECH